jgi:hypothetical protein
MTTIAIFEAIAFMFITGAIAAFFVSDWVNEKGKPKILTNQ